MTRSAFNRSMPATIARAAGPRELGQGGLVPLCTCNPAFNEIGAVDPACSAGHALDLRR